MGHSQVIKVSGLSYRYGKDELTLSGIDLEVERGVIYGFLGPNGSGKTTTLSLLLGLLQHQKGSIEIFGQPLQADRLGILKRIGSLIEAPSLYGHLTAVENLEIYRPLYGATKARVAEVLDIVGLADTGKKLTKRFSLGMKQRLAIALALLPSPELLILDEPTNGLDPAGIIELRGLIRKLNEQFGMTLLISSHMLSEVEKMVTHVGIIYKGKTIFQGSLPELRQFQQKGARLLVNTSNNEAAMKLLQEYHPVHEGEAFSIAFQDKGQVASIQRRLFQDNLEVYLIHPKGNDLEKIFIDLTTAQS